MYRHIRTVHREVLEALVKLYEQNRRMVKSKEVAKILNKDEGTVRNVIMWLKSMGYVESRTGPAGGYIPTLKAYEVLRGVAPQILEPGYGVVIVFRDSEDIRMSAVSMEIMGLFSSEPAKALVKVVGDLTMIEEGLRARIESLPKKRLVVDGVIRKRDLNANELLIEIQKMSVIPGEYVSNVGSKKLITIKSSSSVREASRILYTNGIRGAPIVDEENNIVGFITTTDIAMIVANGEDLEAPVSKYMRRTVFTISDRESLVEAMKIMDFYGVGRLIILNGARRPVGIITRTDILRYILAI
ncbi:MAG: CBS domain-containing protein [Thermoprotei archaeon]|nr:CBS domain-containing protein [Thermoprotei archaeon]